MYRAEAVASNCIRPPAAINVGKALCDARKANVIQHTHFVHQENFHLYERCHFRIGRLRKVELTYVLAVEVEHLMDGRGSDGCLLDRHICGGNPRRRTRLRVYTTHDAPEIHRGQQEALACALHIMTTDVIYDDDGNCLSQRWPAPSIAAALLVRCTPRCDCKLATDPFLRRPLASSLPA